METNDKNKKSRESLEASIVLGSDRSTDESALFDDNLENYSTPTGSTQKLNHSSDDDRQHHSTATADNIASIQMTTSPERNVQDDIIEDLREENAQLRALVQELSERPRSDLEKEINSLTSQLKEATTYVDQVDVEAEQQYTELTGEIDELIALVEEKDKDIAKLKTELADTKKEAQKQAEQLESQKISNDRQAEIIEMMSADLDKSSTKMKDVLKEKERLRQEMSKVQAKLDTQKGELLTKEVMMSLELEDVQRELEKQKDMLAGTSMSEVVNKWERRVLNLENKLSERDIIIHTQQSLINKLRHQTMPSPSRVLSASGGSSSESFQSRGENYFDDQSKSTLLNFLTSDRNAQLANVYAIGRILDLSNHEQQYLEAYLNGRSPSRFY